MRDATTGNARGRRTRTALLDATRAILERSGFGGLTMAAVAARAGVSRRAVYLHFETRTDLITALFDHVSDAEGLSDSLNPVFDAADARAALRAWARHLAYFQPRVMAVYQAAQAHASADPDAARHLAQVADDQRSVCTRIAKRLAAENRLAAPWTVPTARDMLWALISPDMIHRLLADQAWPNHRLATHLDAMLTATFLTTPK
ncbi:MAG TPA: helix-turn-helix domain-containing protein [Streptosporangiaceae bacterium]|jgi:AcrR family transcriptional regulator